MIELTDCLFYVIKTQSAENPLSKVDVISPWLPVTLYIKIL